MAKKSFQIIYKFGDVIDNIEAETIEEAKRIANERLMGDYNPQNDTECYDIEIEELLDN